MVLHPSTTPTDRAQGPSLAARLLRKLRPPRRLRFTREGKYFVLLTFAVGVAAINTGNNPLYLVLGMLCALIIVSGIMSEMSLRGLRVVRRLPPRAQAGRPHLVEIEVHNRKRRFPSYAIEVEDLRAGQPTDKRCFFLKVSARSAQVAAYRRKPMRRGMDRHTGFRIATRFPFGLFEKSLQHELEGELVIYPPIDPVRLPQDHTGADIGAADALGRGAGDEIIGLRPMRDGDDPRDIYWRKSTRPEEFVLKERAREGRPDALLVLDDLRPATHVDAWNADFERRIRAAASHAVALLRRGHNVRLTTTSGRDARASSGVGADPILRFLALIEAVDRGAHTDPRQLPGRAHPARAVLVFASRSEPQVAGEP